MKKTCVQALFIFAVIISMLAGIFAIPAYTHASSSCPLSPQNGRTIIYFGGMALNYDSSSSYETSAVSTSVPVGTYTITLVSYDDHAIETEAQANEQWVLNMKTAQGNIVGVSNPIGDLPDGQHTLTQTVNTDYRVTDTIAFGVGRHVIASGNNSITPVCAVFDLAEKLPSVTTDAADSIWSNSALLHGTVNPNGSSEAVSWFEWGENSSLDWKTAERRIWTRESIEARINGLKKGVTYYFRAAARNGVGTSYGPLLTFTIPGAGTQTASVTTSNANSNNSNTSSAQSAPGVSTRTPTFITQDTVVLNGTVNADTRVSTNVWFEWGTDKSLGKETARRNIGYINSANIKDGIIGLAPNTLYYVRAVAENAYGRGYGSIITFQTSPVPVKTQPPVVAHVQPAVVSACNCQSRASVAANANISDVSDAFASDTVAVMITPSDDMLIPGRTVPLTATFQNKTANSLTNTTITITLPPELIYQKSSSFPSPFAQYPAFDASGQIITFSIGVMAPGQTDTIMVDAVLKSDTPNKKIFTTTAEITYMDTVTQTNGRNRAFAVNTAGNNTELAAVPASGKWTLWLFLGVLEALVVGGLFVWQARLRKEEKKEIK